MKNLVKIRFRQKREVQTLHRQYQEYYKVFTKIKKESNREKSNER